MSNAEVEAVYFCIQHSYFFLEKVARRLGAAPSMPGFGGLAARLALDAGKVDR
jgi:hypothetical protein